VVPKARELALIIIVLFAMIGTEFTSNVSMASILLPIADSVVKFRKKFRNVINLKYLFKFASDFIRSDLTERLD